MCEPTYFEKCIDVLEKDSSVVLCYANTTVIDETGKPLSTYTEDLHLISPTPSTRYRQFNQRFLKKYKCNAVFGIIRTSVLQETDLIGHYEASDIILLAELALRGKVYEVPEHLFLRRDHPQMSGRANPTAQAIAAWFDPTNRKQLVLPMNRLLLEHIRAIHRVPMSTQERLRCYLQLLTFIRWKRREMGKELTEWLQVSMHGITHRTLHHPST